MASSHARNVKKAAAARAREGRACKHLGLDVTFELLPDSEPATQAQEGRAHEHLGLDVTSELLPDLEPEELRELVLEEDDLEMLADMLEDLDLWDPADGPMDFGQESDSEVEELQGEELVRSLEEKEARTESAFEVLMKERSVKEWGHAENSSWMGVYNGHSDRTKHYYAQKVVEKKKKDAAMRNTNTAKAFTSFFIPIQKAVVVAPESIPRTCTPESDPTPTLPNPSPMFS
ncbi:hypothetical protein F5051DRAFT_447285, partial [Lentinula edodes]